MVNTKYVLALIIELLGMIKIFLETFFVESSPEDKRIVDLI